MQSTAQSQCVLRAYQYRLLPRRKQHRALGRILELQRELYNGALQERIDAYRKAGWSPGRYDQFKSLTKIRAQDPTGYGALPANLSRETLRRLDEAFHGFFDRVRAGRKAGFPRFKSKARWSSFGFAEFSGLAFDGTRIRFKGMPGGLRVHLHRPLPSDGEIVTCQIVRNAKAWLVSFHVRERVPGQLHTGPAVGIDLGVEKFATLSDGTVIPSLRAARRAQAALRRAQRSLSRARIGSASRRDRRRYLARAHLKIANARTTHLHQASSMVAGKYSLIGIESLQVQQLCTSAHDGHSRSALNRSILDAGWRKFSVLIRYKAAWAGGRVIGVDPRNTSQKCSGCGAIVYKPLNERQHRCVCGLVIDRDLNAARNVLMLALGDQEPAPDWRGPGRSGLGPVQAACGNGRFPAGRPVGNG